jgi:hypothetical protein
MIKLCPFLVFLESRIALNYRHEFGTLPSMDLFLTVSPPA